MSKWRDVCYPLWPSGLRGYKPHFTLSNFILLSKHYSYCPRREKVPGFLFKPIHHSQGKRRHLPHSGSKVSQRIPSSSKSLYGISLTCPYFPLPRKFSGLCGLQECLITYPHLPARQVSPAFCWGSTKLPGFFSFPLTCSMYLRSLPRCWPVFALRVSSFSDIWMISCYG